MIAFDLNKIKFFDLLNMFWFFRWRDLLFWIEYRIVTRRINRVVFDQVLLYLLIFLQSILPDDKIIKNNKSVITKSKIQKEVKHEYNFITLKPIFCNLLKMCLLIKIDEVCIVVKSQFYINNLGYPTHLIISMLTLKYFRS